MKKRFYLVFYLLLIVGAGAIKQVGNFISMTGSDWFLFFRDNLLMISGAIFGFYFIFFEKFWQVFYLYPEAKESQWVKEYIKKRSLKNLGSFLVYLLNIDFSHKGRSVLNSFLFHFSWLGVAVFVLTSTASTFGQGLVLGLGLYLLVEAWEIYQKSTESFRGKIFWQIERPISPQEAQYYLYIFSAIFGMLSLFFS